VLASRISAISPLRATEGGRISIHGEHLLDEAGAARSPAVRVGTADARVVRASNRQIDIVVPPGEEGRLPIRLEGVPGATAFLDVASRLAEGLHLVDNPVFDDEGVLYATFSGSRSQQAALSIFRIRPDGSREPLGSGIAHPTSMVFGPDRQLYVSDRFEGAVYRMGADGRAEVTATDLGVPFGLAFSSEGSLYIGDRSGEIVKIDRGGVRTTVAKLPASVAAYHLAWGPDERLYVSAPTLASRDPIYRVADSGEVEMLPVWFGRPQGLAFDGQGLLYVVEALAGSTAVVRLRPDDPASIEPVAAGVDLVGLAFDPAGRLALASSDAVWTFEP
jgi:sugar lactone lactonase YvrE